MFDISELILGMWITGIIIYTILIFYTVLIVYFSIGILNIFNPFKSSIQKVYIVNTQNTKSEDEQEVQMSTGQKINKAVNPFY